MPEAVPNRVAYGRTLVELGERDPRIVALDADVAKSTNTCQFRDRFPERFFNCGVAEQNMICVAAGLASAGKIPFVSTFVVFASMRACEQIRTSVAYPRLNVKIVATNGGLDNFGDGVTHQGIEDLAILRAIPNLMVLSPADPVTTAQAVRAIAAYDGPVYMRMGRNAASGVHAPDVEFQLGRMIRLRDGNDVTLIATGHQVEQALLAAAELAREGVQARVLDCHTLKPIDVEAIEAAARETAGIVTVEDHNIIGGLGSAVAEVVAERHPAFVRRVGVRDVFASSARDARKLLAHYHVDAAEVVRQAKAILELKRR
jgi:transketolase